MFVLINTQQKPTMLLLPNAMRCDFFGCVDFVDDFSPHRKLLNVLQPLCLPLSVSLTLSLFVSRSLSLLASKARQRNPKKRVRQPPC